MTLTGRLSHSPSGPNLPAEFGDIDAPDTVPSAHTDIYQTLERTHFLVKDTICLIEPHEMLVLKALGLNVTSRSAII